jgi:hypothetical protein
MLIYLCGAVENSPHHAPSWRAEIARSLHELGHEVYDPVLDEKKDLTDQEAREFRGWKHSDMPRFQKAVRKMIQYDLDWIEERCDALVVHWEEGKETASAQGELTVAYRRGLPIYLVTPTPLAQVSGWVLGCASHIFPSFEALGEYLRGQRARAIAYA